MIKRILKTVSKSQTIQNIIAWLAASYMRLVYYTSRWQFIGRHVFENYRDAQRPAIICFWHNRLGLMAYARLKGMPFNVMISSHRDGRIISKAMGHHCIKTIAGSSSRGSLEAVRKVLETLKKGEFVAITPDGPRGPRFSINPSLLKIASKAGVDIIPIAYATSRRIVISSWDRFVVPLPFSRGVFMYGEPITLNQRPTDEDINRTCELLRERLIDISNQSDQLCGREIIPTVETEKTMAG